MRDDTYLIGFEPVSITGMVEPRKLLVSLNAVF